MSSYVGYYLEVWNPRLDRKCLLASKISYIMHVYELSPFQFSHVRFQCFISYYYQAKDKEKFCTATIFFCSTQVLTQEVSWFSEIHQPT
jgi:hypothetical protein